VRLANPLNHLVEGMNLELHAFAALAGVLEMKGLVEVQGKDLADQSRSRGAVARGAANKCGVAKISQEKCRQQIANSNLEIFL